MKRELLRIIQNAGEIMLCSKAYDIERKDGHANYVTAVDQEIQQLLAGELSRLLPGSSVIGEEGTNEPLGMEPTWVIDPLDGTTNFIHQCRFSAVSVALLIGRQPVIGAVYQPYNGEMFYAEKEKGAFLNDDRIHVSPNDLSHGLVAFGTAPYNAELAETSMRVALGFLRQAADIRRGGSAALDMAYLACGRYEAFFEFSLKPWDYAAGALLVNEAGGLFDMPFLDKPDFNQNTAVLATNRICAKQAAEIFAFGLKPRA